MKGDAPKTPREETEARVTALLLSELPPEQAAALEAQIAADPELKSLHARLREAIALVREASTIREQPAPATLARLSEERRERLLEYFKSEVLPAVQPERKRDWSWVRPLGLAAALIALIGGGLLLDAGLSISDPIVNTASEETFWDSQSGAVRGWKESAAPGEARSSADYLFVLKDGSIGPSSRATENNPVVGRSAFWTDDESGKIAAASPPTPTDRFRDAKAKETKTPWYLAWAAQAPSSNSRLSDVDLPVPSTDVGSVNGPVPSAAAPASPASAPLPALEPAASPTSGAVPATGPLLAGVEAMTAARGAEKSAESSPTVTSALGAVAARPLNQSKSDSDAGVAGTPATPLGKAKMTPFTRAKTPIGQFGQEPVLQAPDSLTAETPAGGQAGTYAFRTPESGDKARFENQLGLERDFLGRSLNDLSLENERKPSIPTADAEGVTGISQGVRKDGLDQFAKNLDENGLMGRKLGSAVDDGFRYYRGRGIEEPGRPFFGDHGKAIEALPEPAVDARAAGLKERATRVDDLAKLEEKKSLPERGEKAIEQQTKEVEDFADAPAKRVQQVEQQLKEIDKDEVAQKRNVAPSVPQPEVSTRENRFSTFSLNVSDVSFKLAAASLENGTMPDPASIRSEEFINAFDYRDPEPLSGAPLAFASERARYPFAQNRDLLRIGIKTAAAGRQPGRALNVVLLVDNSGSMERADRVRILHEALRVLSGQLQPQDKLSIITFARTPRLWIDGVAGDKAGEATARISEITPQGGTNLAAALDLGYQTALRHYQVESINRVVLLTDGAANLGNVDAVTLKEKVEAQRKQGVALDCFGIGWEGYNDDLLEVLSRNGDGRYGFINSVEEAATVFAAQLAGALRVAASDVKAQVEFNPRRVSSYRQVGYAKHQLTKEQFRDNSVDAAEIGAAEAGNGIYLVEVNPRGEGDLATVRVRFKVPGTTTYREHQWSVPFTPNAPPLEQATVALRLAGSASAFSEWLAGSPYAGEITPDALLGLINGVPGAYGADPRPKKLEWMIRQAKSLSGR